MCCETTEAINPSCRVRTEEGVAVYFVEGWGWAVRWGVPGPRGLPDTLGEGLGAVCCRQDLKSCPFTT
jgi:hypothetical protein